MEIFYLGHASFKIKGKKASLITDPFDPSVVGLKFNRNEADIVTISHAHKDHNYLDMLSGQKMVISSAGEYEVMGVSIIGIETDHDSTGGKERGKNIIYVLEVDGVRIAHLGDLGHKLTEKTIEQMGDVDVVMVPVGGHYTIGPREAVEIVKDLESPYILPMHFKAAGMSEELSKKLLPVEDFLREIGYDVEKYDKLILNKELINYEQRKVVLLEKR